jgi:hypothetical protein
VPGIRLMGGEPDLVGDYCHHEKKVETEGPEDKEFGAFQVAAWDGVFFCGHELVVFE